MKPKIWYMWEPGAEIRQKLEPIAEVVANGTMEQLAGASAVVINNVIDASGSFMDQAGPSLKAICRPGIGIDNVNLADATARGILVINTPDAPTESTAEHTVALLMALAKRVVVGHNQVTRWDRSNTLGMELKGRTLGVVGYGRIGRRVVEICGLGLRMNVIVFDPFLPASVAITQPAVERVYSLDELLKQADVLTLHCPSTPETYHLIGKEQLQTLRKGSYLINASRGPVVDEAALIAALQEGHLGGAAMDVFDPEPPPADNPLLTMINVIATPHIASNTDKGTFLMSHGVADQLVQLFSGERPPNICNPQAWPGRMG
ncbi:MAG: hydroxyacid dehydrogenase [Caldilineaceae bacterium]